MVRGSVVIQSDPCKGHNNQRSGLRLALSPVGLKLHEGAWIVHELGSNAQYEGASGDYASIWLLRRTQARFVYGRCVRQNIGVRLMAERRSECMQRYVLTCVTVHSVD